MPGRVTPCPTVTHLSPRMPRKRLAVTINLKKIGGRHVAGTG